MPGRTIDEVYGDFGAVEDAFLEELDRSLTPRGTDMLYDVVAALGPAPGALAVDVGCGDGRHSIELARRFGLRVHGVDAVREQVERGRRELTRVAADDAALTERVRIDLGSADALPEHDGSVALVWCRDMLVHVASLERVLTECRRVLAGDGHLVVYITQATERLEPREASALFASLGVNAANMARPAFETAAEAAGLLIVDDVAIGSEWREALEEKGTARTSRRLLHAARLLRARDHYVARFGEAAYDAMLGDALWGVYQMIGKLCPRIYVLRHARSQHA